MFWANQVVQLSKLTTSCSDVNININITVVHKSQKVKPTLGRTGPQNNAITPWPNSPAKPSPKTTARRNRPQRPLDLSNLNGKAFKLLGRFVAFCCCEFWCQTNFHNSQHLTCAVQVFSFLHDCRQITQNYVNVKETLVFCGLPFFPPRCTSALQHQGGNNQSWSSTPRLRLRHASAPVPIHNFLGRTVSAL